MPDRNLKLVPTDDIDPELIGLRRLRPGIGPLLALSVMGLCLYLIVSLRGDLVFALGSKTPRDFGDAATEYAKGGRVPDNTFVTLHGVPDRGAPAWLRTKQAVGHRLVPVFGTSGELWLQVGDRPRQEPLSYEERYTGRVRRIDDLAFGDELRKFIAGQGARVRYLDPAALARGVPERDLAGDLLALAPETPLLLDERVDGVALVIVYATGPIKDGVLARQALVDAQLDPGVAPIDVTDLSWTFEVRGAVDDLRGRIARGRLYGARVEEKIVPHKGVWRELSVDAAAGTVSLSGAAVPIARLARVAVIASPVVGKDARVLLVGEAPDAFWYVPPLCGLLAVFAGLMAWALARALRPEKALPVPAGVPSTDPP